MDIETIMLMDIKTFSMWWMTVDVQSIGLQVIGKYEDLITKQITAAKK